MIVVTGATGKLGRLIVEQLLEKLPPDRVVASVRDPAKAEFLAKRGVNVRHGDFSLPATLNSAFAGASQVLIVSSNARASGGDPIVQHRNAIEAAKSVGAQRIVYTSHMAVSASSAFPPMHDHAATEAILRDAGIPWTALRHGFYASTVASLIGNAATTGVLSAPADGKVSWTAHADLAGGAASILLHEGQYEGPTPPLTGSEAIDLEDVAAILAAINARPVQRHVISDADQSDRMAQNGLAPAVISMILGLYRAARDKEFSIVDPTLERLLRRKPLSLYEVLMTAHN